MTKPKYGLKEIFCDEYACEPCGEDAFWSIADYRERGLPVCKKCGRDMDLKKEMIE